MNATPLKYSMLLTFIGRRSNGRPVPTNGNNRTRTQQVRKSGNQTLFGTINMHGESFTVPVWRVAVWLVLFPLLNRVKACFLQALAKGEEETNTQPGILVHHSRNTAVKQVCVGSSLSLSLESMEMISKTY